ncbi:hypothetical protein ACFQL1_15945 [Halomicroarcula sp. GCM10025709]|uniref:hypothetical protein n=1 Tax=Halomicroarcula sp. GCM10025709 TaxID=3252669 RepID=UPI00360EFCA3
MVPDLGGNPVQHGDYALQLTGASQIQIGAGVLNADAAAGEAFDWHCYVSSGEVARHLFAVKDQNNHYISEVNNSGEALRLLVEASGTEVTIVEDTTIVIPDDEWLRCNIDWQSDGSITMTVTEVDSGTQVGQISGSDTTYSAGGHGWESL